MEYGIHAEASVMLHLFMRPLQLSVRFCTYYIIYGEEGQLGRFFDRERSSIILVLVASDGEPGIFNFCPTRTIARLLRSLA